MQEKSEVDGAKSRPMPSFDVKAGNATNHSAIRLSSLRSIRTSIIFIYVQGTIVSFGVKRVNLYDQAFQGLPSHVR